MYRYRLMGFDYPTILRGMGDKTWVWSEGGTWNSLRGPLDYYAGDDRETCLLELSLLNIEIDSQ